MKYEVILLDSSGWRRNDSSSRDSTLSLSVSAKSNRFFSRETNILNSPRPFSLRPSIDTTKTCSIPCEWNSGPPEDVRFRRKLFIFSPGTSNQLMNDKGISCFFPKGQIFPQGNKILNWFECERMEQNFSPFSVDEGYWVSLYSSHDTLPSLFESISCIFRSAWRNTCFFMCCSIHPYSSGIEILLSLSTSILGNSSLLSRDEEKRLLL